MNLDLGFSDNEELQTERGQIADSLKKDAYFLACLKKLGIDSSLIERFPMKLNRYREQLYICKECKGLSYCVNKDVGHTATLSIENGKLKQAYNPCKYMQEVLRKEKKEREETPYLKKYILNDVPNDCLRADFDTINISKGEKASYIKAVNLLDSSLPYEKGYYLYGDVGVGKTYLASCISNYYAKQNQSIAFIHVPTYLNHLKNSFDSNVEYEFYLNSVRNADVVVFDDIGAESVTSWSRDDILEPLLNERMNRRLLTIFTSNYSQEDLLQYYRTSSKGVENELGALRLLERVKALSQEVKIEAKNRRHA